MGWTKQYKYTARVIICIIAVLSLANCRPGPRLDNVITPVQITFLHMNDLHAHLTPHNDLVREGTTSKIVQRGGLARLATVINGIRNDVNIPNDVLMNIGDTYHGGVEARYTLGNAIVGPVNALGIDIGVPGNWDFAYDPSTFTSRYVGPINGTIKQPDFKNLAANLTNTLTGNHILPATDLRYIGGIWVGFIGITSDIVPMMHPALSLGFSFTRGEVGYKNLINSYAKRLVEKKAAVIVVMSELGLHKNKRLADVIDPGLVDVFFTGHTHEATFSPITSASGALVVEAGNDGYLGRMDVFLDKAEIVNMEWSLIPIDATIPEDPAMKALVEEVRVPFLAENVNMVEPLQFSQQKLTQPINTVVGKTSVPLDRRNALEHTFNNTFTDWLRNAAGTDLAITPGFRFDSVVAGSGYLLEGDSVATGDVTLEDVYRFIPVHFTMGLAQSNGTHLKRTLENALINAFSLNPFAQNGGWFSGVSGLLLTVDLTRPDGMKITSMRLKSTGALITDTTVLSVAGCIRPLEFRDKLCSYPGFSKYVELINPKTASAYTGTDFLIQSLQANTIHTVRDDVTDVSGTLLWPSSEYLQPIGIK